MSVPAWALSTPPLILNAAFLVNPHSHPFFPSPQRTQHSRERRPIKKFQEIRTVNVQFFIHSTVWQNINSWWRELAIKSLAACSTDAACCWKRNTYCLMSLPEEWKIYRALEWWTKLVLFKTYRSRRYLMLNGDSVCPIHLLWSVIRSFGNEIARCDGK